MQTFTTLTRSLLLVTLLALLTVVPAQARDAAGKILVVNGSCSATDTAGTTRTLARGDSVASGETLRTGADSSMQIRFTDGSLLALRSDTEFRIDEFQYRAGSKDGISLMSLVKGGFRTITGLVGKLKPDAYKVRTPVATIGVRGTNYEAMWAGGLYVAAWKGTISVENKGGTTLLGEGADHKFAFIADNDSAPQGSDEPPAILGGKPDLDEPAAFINPPPGGINVRPPIRGQIIDGSGGQ